MWLFAVLVLAMPLLGLALTSLVSGYGVVLSAATATLDNYRFVLFEHAAAGRAFVNSVWLSALAAAFAVVVAVPIGYLVAWGGGGRWIRLLSLAVELPYALPGVFEPVRWGERMLVDGALVNPVPVSVCRAYEQRLVLAVNLHYDQYGRAAVIKHAQPRDNGLSEAVRGEKEARLGITGVMMEAFNIIQDRISRARMAGDPPDVTLMPVVGQIGLADFHRAAEAIDAGYTETVKRLEDIQRLQGIAD